MHNRATAALGTLLITALVAGCGGPSAGPVVSTPLGETRGTLHQTDGPGDVREVHVFRDLPYAQPPVGERRWQRPVAATGWEGVRDATNDRAICEQPLGDGDLNSGFLARLLDGAGVSGFGRFVINTFAGMGGGEPMSEDCLTLTVRTPSLETDAQLPVMVWIHGGAHRYGSGNQGFSDSNALASRGVVHVSINYRLGIWGFLAHSDLAKEDANGSTGNYGLLDQIESLKWVQANIAAFGGNPDNVTIFGESAGGHSVGQILASPLATGLVHGAIAQSGTGNHQMRHVQHAVEGLSGVEAGNRFARLAGIEGADKPAQLRTLSVEQIRELENRDPEIANTFHPHVDGYALPVTVAQIFASGQQAKVPLLLGSNSDEGTVLGYVIPVSMDGVSELRPETVADWDSYLQTHAPEIAQEYAVEQASDLWDAHFRLLGDSLFGRHAYYTAENHVRTGTPTWLYFFERTPASDTQTIGATHALELQPVFNSYIPFWPKDARDEELAAQMGDYWTNFAKTKNPNGVGLPQWPEFDITQTQELSLGHNHTQARPVDRKAIYEGMRPQQQRRLARMRQIAGGAR